jgi:hypothetical protein
MGHPSESSLRACALPDQSTVLSRRKEFDYEKAF